MGSFKKGWLSDSGLMLEEGKTRLLFGKQVGKENSAIGCRSEAVCKGRHVQKVCMVCYLAMMALTFQACEKCQQHLLRF